MFGFENSVCPKIVWTTKHSHTKSKKRINGNVEFVGPICESSDTFLKYKNFTYIYTSFQGRNIKRAKNRLQGINKLPNKFNYST